MVSPVVSSGKVMSKKATVTRRPLADYLAMAYPFNVIADPDGGYVVEFPDLSGCMTQVESIEEVGPMAEEIRRLWIETAYEHLDEIPLPSFPEEYSGRFVVRLARSLHRSLAQAAELQEVSLNQYVASLLARADAQEQVLRRLEAI